MVGRGIAACNEAGSEVAPSNSCSESVPCAAAIEVLLARGNSEAAGLSHAAIIVETAAPVCQPSAET